MGSWKERWYADGEPKDKSPPTGPRRLLTKAQMKHRCERFMDQRGLALMFKIALNVDHKRQFQALEWIGSCAGLPGALDRDRLQRELLVRWSDTRGNTPAVLEGKAELLPDEIPEEISVFREESIAHAASIRHPKYDDSRSGTD